MSDILVTAMTTRMLVMAVGLRLEMILNRQPNHRLADRSPIVHFRKLPAMFAFFPTVILPNNNKDIDS